MLGNGRFNVIASSLSSYFGVGFQTIDEQLDIDMGIAEKEFDEDAQDRMDLGNAMEDGCLNYFEKKLNISIDERNSEYKYACNGLLKCKRDGRTFLDGVETGVENKYSNSKSGSFMAPLVIAGLMFMPSIYDCLGVRPMVTMWYAPR